MSQQAIFFINRVEKREKVMTAFPERLVVKSFHRIPKKLRHIGAMIMLHACMLDDLSLSRTKVMNLVPSHYVSSFFFCL